MRNRRVGSGCCALVLVILTVGAGASSAHADPSRKSELQKLRQGGLMKEYRAERRLQWQKAGYKTPTVRGVLAGVGYGAFMAGTATAAGGIMAASAAIGRAPEGAIKKTFLITTGVFLTGAAGLTAWSEGTRLAADAKLVTNSARRNVIELHGL